MLLLLLDSHKAMLQTFTANKPKQHIENWTGLQTLRDVDMELYTGLQRLNLSKNPMLTTLSWQIFEHLQLFELHLEEVVFTCGCEIRWLQLWQQRGEAGLSSQQLECDDGLKIKVLQVMNISSCDLPEISVSHSNLTVKEGDRVTAICNGSGSPLPEVDWPVNGLHSINAQEAKVYDNNTIHSINITLVNVSRDDNNFLLTCTATNIVGMTNASVQLTVHFSSVCVDHRLSSADKIASAKYTMSFPGYPDPPTILKLLEPERRHDTCIEFTVRGWPHPTLQWFYKDKEISHTEYVRPDMDTYQDYIEGCLTFNVPTHHNNGNYTLVATNELGEAVSTIYGHFMDKPIVDSSETDYIYVTPTNETHKPDEDTFRVSVAVGLAAFACVVLVLLFLFINQYGRRSKFGLK
ncbi:NT-3 growth factor receptor, partial [Dissostichus eleginoides]